MQLTSDVKSVRKYAGDLTLMAHHPRVLEAARIYFVTQRTFQSRLFLRPSREINALVGGVLARALSRHKGVELFAFVIMSNHVHLILRGDVGEIPKFMGYFSGMTARRVGKRVGWRGKFWHGPYDAAPILDDDALIGRLQYIMAHGAKEGLVTHARDWPGLSSRPELTSNKKRRFTWRNGTAEWEAARRKNGRKPDAERYPLTLAVVPEWAGLSERERRQRAQSIAEEAEHQARDERRNKPALGVAKVFAQHPLSVPRDTKRGGARPLCHASSVGQYAGYRDAWRATVTRYREASQRWRDGFFAEFPQASFRPPTPCDWPLRAPAYSLARMIPLSPAEAQQPAIHNLLFGIRHSA